MSRKTKIQNWNPILNFPSSYKDYKYIAKPHEVIKFRQLEFNGEFISWVSQVRKEFSLGNQDIDEVLYEIESLKTSSEQRRVFVHDYDSKLQAFLESQKLPQNWFHTLVCYLNTNKIFIFGSHDSDIILSRVGDGFGELVEDFIGHGVFIYIQGKVTQSKLREYIYMNWESIESLLEDVRGVNSTRKRTIEIGELVAFQIIENKLSSSEVADYLTENFLTEDPDKAYTDENVRKIFERYMASFGIYYRDK